MANPIFMLVRAGEGCTVFATDDRERVFANGRRITSDPEGERIHAIMTADGRMIAASEFHRAALRSGDLIEVVPEPAPEPAPEPSPATE